jgi:glycosyltransferase involved in cell wall biosynthesis
VSRLRVCHVITQLELGGAQRNTLYTVSHLDRDRFEPSVIAGPGGLLDEEARTIDGLRFETCPTLARPVRPLADLRALADLRRRIARLGPDIVHTHSSKAGILGRAAAFAAGVPVIVHTVHGWGFHAEQSRLERLCFAGAEQLAHLVTTQLVAVSEANAVSGAAWHVAPRESFIVIRSGIELSRFRDAAGGGRLRNELGLERGAPLVVMVGCLKPQKAPLDFVAVAEAVARQMPDARFALAGDGALRPDVERAVEAAGLGGRLHLLGWRRDPEAVIGDADVLVLTSRHEGLPRVVPEALAAGVPVVATAVDGTPEAVIHGRTGLLAAPGDVGGLAAAVVRILGDPALRRRLAQTGREHAKGWDIDEMVRTQERLYEALARRAGLRGAAAAS